MPKALITIPIKKVLIPVNSPRLVTPNVWRNSISSSEITIVILLSKTTNIPHKPTNLRGVMLKEVRASNPNSKSFL